MKRSNQLKVFTLTVMISMLLVLAQNTFAHTRLRVPVIEENTANHGSTYNDVVIGHGCQNTTDGASTIDTLGTVIVFPDGKDSIITVNGAPHDGTLFDFIVKGVIPITKVQDRSIFTHEDYIKAQDGLTNVGFWVGGGSGLRAGFRGLFPFTTAGVVIQPDSCVKSITFVTAIADICEITDPSGFTDATVQLWTPAVGSIYDGAGLHGYDSPATLKVNRSATPLPESCGEGVDVVVKPSAEQLNRDLQIKLDGQKIWPR
ncbi:MAG: hypothetical protein KIT59_09385 [Nitrosomonas sp.]|nr:hypothetical protein [Nitrosomonas sp.]